MAFGNDIRSRDETGYGWTDSQGYGKTADAQTCQQRSYRNAQKVQNHQRAQSENENRGYSNENRPDCGVERGAGVMGNAGAVPSHQSSD